MTQRFDRVKVENRYAGSPGATFEDYEFSRCTFENSGIAGGFDVERRPIVRRVSMIGCTASWVSLGAVIAEDVLVDGLRTRNLLQCWSPVLKHVVVRGRVGRIMLSPYVAPSSASPLQQRAFEIANATYYAGVDWALDITEAEPEELELGGVPARLVRRDPGVSAVVTRAAALRGAWRQVDLQGTWWAAALERLATDPGSDVVLVAPRRNRAFPSLVDGLRRLKDAGIAEPD